MATTQEFTFRRGVMYDVHGRPMPHGKSGLVGNGPDGTESVYSGEDLLRTGNSTVTTVFHNTAHELHTATSPLANEPGLFQDEAEYDRVATRVAERIRSGQVQPREPEEDEEEW